RDFHVTGVQTCALPICKTPAGDMRQLPSDIILQCQQVAFDVVDGGIVHDKKSPAIQARKMSPLARSIIVEGRAWLSHSPSTTRSSWSPNCSRHWFAVLAGWAPLTFALVDTSKPPKALHNAAATGCCVRRTPTLACSPRIHAGTLSDASIRYVVA